MKLLSIAPLLLLFAGNLYGYDDAYRKKEVAEANKSEGYPTKMPNGVLIQGYVYNADLDAMVLVCVGQLGKSATAKKMRDHWNGQVGQALRKKGFRDFAISVITQMNGDGFIFSPRFNKWMSIDDYLKLK
jgi:hypothetical protein